MMLLIHITDFTKRQRGSSRYVPFQTQLCAVENKAATIILCCSSATCELNIYLYENISDAGSQYARV